MNKKGTALVTGASRGIGKAAAIGLAEDGFDVVLIGRSIDALQVVLNEITQKQPLTGAQHSLYDLDITDFDKVKDLIQHVYQKYSRIDILINNAGIYYPGTFDLSVDEFEKMLRVNLTAQYVFMQAVMPLMKMQKNGYVINIASRAGKYGFSEDGGYSASKFGLVGLNESVYREFAEYGIRATSVCPGWTNTDMGASAPISAEEMIQPSDIVKTIRWLLSLSPSVRIREVIIECKESIL